MGGPVHTQVFSAQPDKNQYRDANHCGNEKKEEYPRASTMLPE